MHLFLAVMPYNTVTCRLKAGISKSENNRHPLPGNGSMTVVPAATIELDMESACGLGIKARSRENVDVASTLDAVTSETRNRTLREGVF
jgi:hypothetical protein